MNKTVGIVGAGINGLCLAFVLMQRGYKVTVFDQAPLGSNNSSFLEWQVLRTHYTRTNGYLSQIRNAMADWKKLFDSIGRDFIRPIGIASISCEEGDWSNRLINDLRIHDIEFRLLSHDQLSALYPGFDFPEPRQGIVSDSAGIMDSRRLIECLGQFITRNDLGQFSQNHVSAIIDSLVVTHQGRFGFDYIIVTADHVRLFGDAEWEHDVFTACYCDLIIPAEYDRYWRYAPAWVDLGGNGHHWGIPSIGGNRMRIASGALTTIGPTDPEEQQRNLLSSYAKLVRDFDRYSIDEFRQCRYIGRADGRLQLQVHENVIGFQGDSGHGFKFAATHAFAIADAIDSGAYHSAVRAVAGIA